MFFANARGIEDRINAEVAAHPALEHVLLQCSGVNDIDASALESLEAIASRLKDSGIALHFSEIKGPVMDKLQRTQFLEHLPGRVFLTNYQAIQALTPELIQRR
jgi:SulP family sulfate permease